MARRITSLNWLKLYILTRWKIVFLTKIANYLSHSYAPPAEFIHNVLAGKLDYFTVHSKDRQNDVNACNNQS